MSKKRVFIDTAYVQALIDKRDQYHQIARRYDGLFQNLAEFWITETVLIEIGDALSAIDRSTAFQFINRCLYANKIMVVSVDTLLLKRSLQLYQTRPDKTWGLTDCVSFIVMQENGLKDTLTSDRHFVQAGFRALLLEDR